MPQDGKLREALEKVRPILDEMSRQSDVVDDQCGYSGYDKALIELALLARHFLREFDYVALLSAPEAPREEKERTSGLMDVIRHLESEAAEMPKKAPTLVDPEALAAILTEWAAALRRLLPEATREDGQPGGMKLYRPVEGDDVKSARCEVLGDHFGITTDEDERIADVINARISNQPSGQPEAASSEPVYTNEELERGRT